MKRIEDAQLISLLRGKPDEVESAMRYIIENIHPHRSAIKWAKQYSISVEDAEDTVQESLIALWRNVAKPDFELKKSSLSTYLHTIIKYQLMKLARRQQKLVKIEEKEFKEVLEGRHPEIVDAFNIPSNSPPREAQRLLSKQLGTTCLGSLRLWAWGYTTEELSEKFGLTPGSMRNRLVLCRQKLRDIFKQNPETVSIIKAILG